jgi:hypothetical protein
MIALILAVLVGALAPVEAARCTQLEVLSVRANLLLDLPPVPRARRRASVDPPGRGRAR